MTASVKMRFKDFEFPANPAVIKTEFSANVREDPLFQSDSAIYNISRNAAVISGEGCFWGEERFTASALLKKLHNSSESGWLFLPDGGCFNAFFTSLSLEEDAKKGCVSYSFSFTENCLHVKDEYDFGFTLALEGENMFDIAHRCGVAIETLMRLNDYKTPFSVKEGDRVVLK